MKGECEFCGERQSLNRYFLCAECWKAQDRSMGNTLLTKPLTASFALKDILPVVTLDLEDESLEQSTKFYSGYSEWRK